MTDQFPEIAAALRCLPDDALLDGELVVADGSSKSDFEECDGGTCSSARG
jgi:ATP-dependent DNA ligase